MAIKPSQIDVKLLDQIVEKMIGTVASSKKEIFKIGEQSRQEYENLSKELELIKVQVKEAITDGEQLEKHEKLARIRLTEVSRHFKKFSESDVRSAYEKAHQLQIDLTMNRQKEKQLRDRRDDLERRMRNLGETIARAEALAGQVTVVLNYLSSDIKKMGEMIEDAKKKQEFGLKIIEAQEEERRKLSREIHDGPAQMLANVMLRSDLVDRIYKERGIDEAMEEIRGLRKMVQSALYEVRKIIYDLRPMALDDLGLIPTLKRYLDTVGEYNNITINFESINCPEKRVPSRFEVALFRLVQEAVQNACKHAKASKVEVKIDYQQSNLILLVKDNGKGFDPAIAKEDSFGLIGMRERVEMLEGEMTIDTAINKGTVIMFFVPLSNEE